LPNPIVLEHIDAVGRLSGQPVRVSMLNATAIVLTSLGADQIIVPVPSASERNRVAEVLDQLPSTRRNLVKLVDGDGKILSRVDDFMLPIRNQASKWQDQTSKPHEALFLNFASDMLYNLALGCKYGAAIASDSLGHVMCFAPQIDTSVFSGEARYRFAELVFITSRYDPSLMFKSEVVGQVSKADIRNLFWRIIDSSEYAAVVSTSGRLGLVRHPAVLLHRLERAIRNLVMRPEFKDVIKAGEVAAELAKFPVSLSSMAELAGGLKRGSGFAPPFIELPISTEHHIAEASLKQLFPNATFREGTIYAVERSFAGQSLGTFIREGEEWKLVDHPQKELRNLKMYAQGTRKLAADIEKE
jgi:hypothetical protein